jgi:hypothetical protein
MRRFAAIALVAACAHDPFAILRDPRRRWRYELAHGSSPRSLEVVPGIIASCQVASVDRIGALTVSTIHCEATSATSEPVPAQANRDIFVAFDGDGVREVAGLAGPTLVDPAKALAFTFPHRLQRGTWSFAGEGATFTVRNDWMNALGKVRELWFSSATWHASRSDPEHEQERASLAAFSPAVGVYLLCDRDGATGELACLRMTWVGTE